MNKRKTRKYADEDIGEIKIVKDFLPSPEKLVLKDDTVKITISLTKRSLTFFKKQAKEHHTQYQKMIRSLIDQYAERYHD